MVNLKRFNIEKYINDLIDKKNISITSDYIEDIEPTDKDLNKENEIKPVTDEDLEDLLEEYELGVFE